MTSAARLDSLRAASLAAVLAAGAQACVPGRPPPVPSFAPEPHPGAPPVPRTLFADYIARIHRSIHQQWSDGYLARLDGQPRGGPNDPSLVTNVEIVLKDDGSIDKLSLVSSSGSREFDAAVIDSVYLARPYPKPPREILSANGKVYIHWRFYRDDRQCSPIGADYFILANPPAPAGPLP
jgi:TonB family protein